MAGLRMRIPQLLSAVLLASLIVPAQSLFFLLESKPKCFYEELPKDTLVVGHFRIEEENPSFGKYERNPNLGVLIHVDEVFNHDHRVVNVQGSDKGSFTFTAAESGEHRLCFTPSFPDSGRAITNVNRLSLDLAIGATSEIESTDKGKIEDIIQKVKDLNGRLQDIRREQVFQREREAEFRDQSESTNSRVVRWTLLQLVVLGITCAWQLSHLRAFFIKQKLT